MPRYRPCRDCGVTAYSFRCRPCWQKSIASKRQPCPICHGRKAWGAKRCGTCYEALRITGRHTPDRVSTMVLDLWWCRQGMSVTPRNHAPVVLRVLRRTKAKPPVARPVLRWPAPVADEHPPA